MRYIMAVLAILVGVALGWAFWADCLPTVYLETADLPAEVLPSVLALAPVGVVLTGLLAGAMVAGGSYVLARAWR